MAGVVLDTARTGSRPMVRLHRGIEVSPFSSLIYAHTQQTSDHTHTTQTSLERKEGKANIVVEETINSGLRNDELDAALVVEHRNALHAGLQNGGDAREARSALHSTERVPPCQV